jgi:DNA-directed RNA polymerase specialized sigma24 family protein
VEGLGTEAAPRHEDGQRGAQTASVVGISVGEVKSHAARAMAALRAVLDTSG